MTILTCSINNCTNTTHGWWCTYEHAEQKTHFHQHDTHWGENSQTVQTYVEAYMDGWNYV